MQTWITGQYLCHIFYSSFGYIIILTAATTAALLLNHMLLLLRQLMLSRVQIININRLFIGKIFPLNLTSFCIYCWRTFGCRTQGCWVGDPVGGWDSGTIGGRARVLVLPHNINTRGSHQFVIVYNVVICDVMVMGGGGY